MPTLAADLRLPISPSNTPISVYCSLQDGHNAHLTHQSGLYERNRRARELLPPGHGARDISVLGN